MRNRHATNASLNADSHAWSAVQANRTFVLRAAMAAILSLTPVYSGLQAAVPETRASTYLFNIPEQGLSDSLETVALALREKLLYSSELIDGKRAPALKGEFTTEQAVRQLLEGTDMDFEVTDGLIVIRPKEAASLIHALGKGARNTTARFIKVANAPAGVAAEPAAESRSLELEEVVVTGSRVITNGNDNPTPVTVVSTEQLLEMNPGPVTQALAMLPALLATPNQGGQGPQPQATINLRGIGNQRNLIMIDGHRVAATTTGNAVDTNLIPTILLKRVDIVTGGASAVYGSDAVSGVVNYVMDNNFNGVKVNAQAGQSTYHDGDTYSIGAAAGGSLFEGRLHAELGLQYFKDEGIHDRFARQWGRGLWSAQGSVPGSTVQPGNSPANPWQLYTNTRFNNVSFGGLITTGPLANLQFAQNGALSSFARGTPTGTATVDIGGDGAYYTTVSAFAGQEMKQAFGRLDFAFTDNVKAYAELAVSNVVNTQHLANLDIRARAIGYNNPYLSTIQPAYQTQVATFRAANPTQTTFNFSRIVTGDQYDAPMNILDANQALLMMGLEGSLGDYDWSVGYEHSESTTKATNPNNYSLPRLFAAMNAVTFNNQIVCNAAVVNPSAYANCVPLNLFGPTASNQAAFDYIRQYTWSKAKYGMDDITFSVTGAPISTWDGPINMAVSGEWRKLTYSVDSNTLPTDAFDCTGIQFNCVAAGAANSTAPYNAATAKFPKASLKVIEFAYEAQVPLLSDAFLAKSLEMNGAARYTNYETSGTVWTWKLGSTWAMNDSLSFRAARSRDIRAPSLQDLFAPVTTTFVQFGDVHTPFTGNVLQRSQGNPDLVPEKADTVTAGFVWTPQFVDGFSLSMDYYRIKINDGLFGSGSRQPATQLICENSGGTSPVCDLYVRPFPFSNTTAANRPDYIVNVNLNAGNLLTYGVDTEISYATDISDHALKIRALLNYQPHLQYNSVFNGPLDVGGAADGVGGLPATPNVKGALQINYEIVNNLGVTVQERYRNAMKQHGSPAIYFAYGKQPPVWYTDLTLNYKMPVGAGNLETFLNVRNLFNKQPDPWASTGGNTQIGSFGGWLQGDDPLGRYFTLGFRYAL